MLLIHLLEGVLKGKVDLVHALIYAGADGEVDIMPVQVNIHEAKTPFLQALGPGEGGEEVIIAKAGKPIVRLVPVDQRIARRVPGSAKGKVTLSPDFDAPLPEAALEEFEGREPYWIPISSYGRLPTIPRLPDIR